MTGCHISIGDLSDFDKDEAWEILKKVVLEICHNPHHIVSEAVRLGMDPRVASEYAVPYVGASIENAGTEDSTLRIIEGPHAEGGPPHDARGRIGRVAHNQGSHAPRVLSRRIARNAQART